MNSLDNISILGSANTTNEVKSQEDEPPSTEAASSDDFHAQKNADAQSYRELRETFSDKAYKVAKYGLYWWATVILLSVAGKICGKELFSDEVLIAITTASTLNLFAAFLGVIRGLFPSKIEMSD